MEVTTPAKVQLAKLWENSLNSILTDMEMTHLISGEMEDYYKFINEMDSVSKYELFIARYMDEVLYGIEHLHSPDQVSRLTNTIGLIVDIVAAHVISFVPKIAAFVLLVTRVNRYKLYEKEAEQLERLCEEDSNGSDDNGYISE